LSHLLAHGEKRIGLYTSPHLYRWNERIRIVSSQWAQASAQNFPDAISNEDLDALFWAAKPHLEAVAAALGQPTEFETITALAFWHFARTKVDAAVLEVGLGGRWDATNTSDPLVSVITHVALDHCDRLGNSLEAIASDKVEITRPHRVLVSAETKPEVLEIFTAHCKQKQARFWPIHAPDWSNDGANLQACLDFISSAPRAMDNFQQINWQTALAAHFAFARARDTQPQMPAAASFDFQVPGRLEVVREKPRIVLDVCNNPDGAAFLVHAFQERFPDAKENTILVLGILADKDYDAMTRLLAPLARVVIATQSQSPRAARACAIAALARPFCPQVEVVTSVKEAVQRALELAKPQDTILIAGSFTNISEAIPVIAQRTGETT
jgi:dihydrofolate synthase/folylpolyglutamate synthase